MTTLTLDVLCAGEAMVDFLPQEAGKAVGDVEHWRRCSGGAVANVAIGLARLGARVAMMGVVGADAFGGFVLQQLRSEGVDTARMRQTEEGKTGLSFVSLDGQGQRTFSFFRTRAADLFWSEHDVDPTHVKGARAVLCGTNALLFRDAQRAAVKLMRAAREAGVMVTFDPNVRSQLWPDPAELRDLLSLLLPLCHVVKVSEEELPWVTGKTGVDEGLQALKQLGVDLPVVTLGDKGAAFLWQERIVRVVAPPATRVDPTGAGDGFMAGLLFGLTRLYADAAALRFAGVGEVREAVTFACAVGARVVERLGAVDGLPTLADIRGQLPKLLRTPRP